MSTTIIKINTADLNEQIIQDLKEKYGNAELEISVHSIQSKITKHQKVLIKYMQIKLSGPTKTVSLTFTTYRAILIWMAM